VNLFEPVDFYCERAGPELWAEPLNAVTNLAFILAGIVLWFQFRREAKVRRLAAILAVLMSIVGLGSLSLHTIAIALTALLDIAGIALFIVTFIGLYLSAVLGWPTWALAIAVLVYFGGTGLAGATGSATVGYVPAWLMLIAMALLGRRAGSPTWGWLVAAAVLFIPSVTFRALDHELCHVFPRGTHFFWHLFNAGVLYSASRGLIGHMAGATRSTNLDTKQA